jgi:hypothetical protein
MEGGSAGYLRGAQSLFAVNLHPCLMERDWVLIFPKSHRVSGQEKDIDYILIATSRTRTSGFRNFLQEEQDEHGQGKWEGKQEGKSDKRITESKAQQKESTTLCTNLVD